MWEYSDGTVRGSNALEQADEHAADLHDLCYASIALVAPRQIGVTAELEMIFDLGAGADRDLKKLREVAIRIAAAPFGDVGRDGECFAAQLTDQPGIVRSRDRGTEPLNVEGERVRQSPLSRYQ